MSSQIPPVQPPFADAPATGPLKTGMAVTSLVLGILAFIVCPFVASIAAIITGIVALGRASSEPRRYGGRGMAIGGIVCGCVSLLIVPVIMASILLPSLSRARELSKRLVCASNLKGIGTTLMIYENDHPGEGAPTLGFLISRGEFSTQQSICPGSELNTSNYVIVSGALGSPDGREILAYEPKSNHGDEGATSSSPTGT